jgi:trigger factor
MNSTLTVLPHSEIEIEITLSPAEFDPHAKQAARLISEKVAIQGFRPGKAPYDAVKNKVGEHAIMEEAAEIAVRASYPRAREELIRDGKLSAAHPAIGRPEVTVVKLAPGNDFIYKIKTAVLPAVTLPDWRAIAQKTKAEYREPVADDAEIDRAVAWLAESRVSLVAAGRPAAHGDHVEVDFEIRRDGVKIAEGDSRNHPLVIGQGKFIPGFEDALIGMSPDERKKFSLSVPDDWRERTMAGQSLDFDVTMKAVYRRIMPEITDDFAKTLGDFTSLEALRINIRDGIVAEKTEKERQRVRSMTVGAIAGKADMDVPAVLVAGETEKMIAEHKASIAEIGMQWPDYLLHIKKTEDDLRGEWRDEAQNRVRASLVLREIAREEKIAPTEEEIASRMERYLEQFAGTGRSSRDIDRDDLRDYTQGILRNEKVFELMEHSM